MSLSSKGMTLVELMIVIAIAAILLSVAAPSFNTLIIRSNIETLQDQFALSVITARTEAASRGVNVHLCALPLPTNANNPCTTTDWATNGWAAFYVDREQTPPQIEVLAQFDNPAGYNLTLLQEGTTATSMLTFDSQGNSVTRSRYIFAACDPANTHARGVVVELNGRTSITTGTGLIHTAKFHAAGANNTADTATSINLRCS